MKILEENLKQKTRHLEPYKLDATLIASFVFDIQLQLFSKSTFVLSEKQEKQQKITLEIMPSTNNFKSFGLRTPKYAEKNQCVNGFQQYL